MEYGVRFVYTSLPSRSMIHNPDIKRAHTLCVSFLSIVCVFLISSLLAFVWAGGILSGGGGGGGIQGQEDMLLLRRDTVRRYMLGRWTCVQGWFLGGLFLFVVDMDG